MRFLTVIATLACLALPATLSAQTSRVEYRGEIVDDGGVPISGVFPLTFKLYEQEDGDSAFYEARHFVSVYEGVYDVLLGDVPDDRLNRTAYIAVEVGDIGEFTRHEIALTAVTAPQTRAEVIAEMDITFAEIADRSLFAVEADEAEDCLRLGGRTLDELDRYEEVLGEMAEVRDRLDEMTGARLGSRTTTLERIGGSGGNSYSRTCPPGHVVTGARGGAGALIDSIELICSPLQ